MKGFVRGDFGSALLSALVIVVIASLTNASLGGFYLICLCVMLIWMRLKIGPFEIGLRQRIRSILPSRHRRGRI